MRLEAEGSRPFVSAKVDQPGLLQPQHLDQGGGSWLYMRPRAAPVQSMHPSTVTAKQQAAPHIRYRHCRLYSHLALFGRPIASAPPAGTTPPFPVTMELHELGRHCAVPECHRLDYLPVRCGFCRKEYCHEHRETKDHPDCTGRPSRIVQVCGQCQQPLSGTEVAPHDCDAYNARRKAAKKASRCHVQGCSKTTLVPMECRACGRRICLAHRAPQDHACVPAMKTGRLAQEREGPQRHLTGPQRFFTVQ
ncbi:uncharacterized protein BJ171DRAFT_487551 [Polychytrium aggregatum]|uniref:uncharacterized protein n=1 Tax=Polychytrium aggregatum TaxID=110093 RepID=UPI0022FF226D|nr:uncharacterized protein BJ171DRAFT_487551 [Polychytrium aggregatum]KAI9208882.1 hypothetical protein BJ171DRAFT_487551 [Polychytrium aggregatum]